MSVQVVLLIAWADCPVYHQRDVNTSSTPTLTSHRNLVGFPSWVTARYKATIRAAVSHEMPQFMPRSHTNGVWTQIARRSHTNGVWTQSGIAPGPWIECVRSRERLKTPWTDSKRRGNRDRDRGRQSIRTRARWRAWQREWQPWLDQGASDQERTDASFFCFLFKCLLWLRALLIKPSWLSALRAACPVGSVTVSNSFATYHCDLAVFRLCLAS